MGRGVGMGVDIFWVIKSIYLFNKYCIIVCNVLVIVRFGDKGRCYYYFWEFYCEMGKMYMEIVNILEW